jgi:hypothetical protein
LRTVHGGDERRDGDEGANANHVRDVQTGGMEEAKASVEFFVV